MGLGKYDDMVGGNSVNFVNGFSIPRNIFTLDFVTLVRNKQRDNNYKNTLKEIIYAMNEKQGGKKEKYSDNVTDPKYKELINKI